MGDHEPCVFRGDILEEDWMACSFLSSISLVVIKNSVPLRVVQERREKEVNTKLPPSPKPHGKAKAARLGKRAPPKAWIGKAWKSDEREGKHGKW